MAVVKEITIIMTSARRDLAIATIQAPSIIAVVTTQDPLEPSLDRLCFR
jgi:hypothetical protein